MVNMEWASPESNKFITNVGLITSRGPHGDNVMAAEWTHHVSYKPGMIAISIHTTDATYDNIMETKEFGVNLCADDQNVVSSIAGNTTGREVDKIAVLKELGAKFYEGKKIKVLMIEDASLNVECKVANTIPVGDHVLIIGEAVAVKLGKKDPMAYHGGRYYRLGQQLTKPPPKEMEEQKRIIENYPKKT